jgi:predicted ester cyclase
VNSTLIILGAGCSLNSGYPVANDMFPRLAEFRDSLGNEAVKLRRLVTDTPRVVAKLREQGESVGTLDTLARLIHESHAFGQTMRQRSHFVVAAKISVAALFLFLEPEAVRKGLPGYRKLLMRIFPDIPKVGFRRATQLSRHRVLTFNYDRLFELAFRQYFPDFDGTEALYYKTVLNSSLSLVDSGNLDIDLNRFSFLKLHGSAGLYGFSEQIYPSAKSGNVEHIHSIPDPKSPIPITDAEFFYPKDDPIHSGKPKPVLITFPHEKDHLKKYPSNLLSFKDYIPKIWEAAHDFACQAEEIHIVGYSCPAADAQALEKLFAAAKICRRYLIENPSPGDVCQRLHSLLPKDFSGEVVCKSVSFEQ